MNYFKNFALVTILFFASQINSEVRAESLNTSQLSFFVTQGPQIFPISNNLNLLLNSETFSGMDISYKNEIIFENSLQIESWMTNYNWLEAKDMILETELQFEEWMEKFNWLDNNQHLNEEELTMETWMTDMKSWNIPSK